MSNATAFDLLSLGNLAWTDNWTHGAGTVHGEILHQESRSVWLAQEATTPAAFDALELPDGFLKTGIGESVADVAYFRRSPGAASDGPLETFDVGGMRFARVAVPGVPEPGFRGVLVMPVEKHHRVLYAAGRTLEIMDCGDGRDYVPLMANAAMPGMPPRTDPRPRVLPPGWKVRSVILAADLVVELPCPTRITLFSRTGESFQGPVRLGL